jgi:hypothetical protein
VNDRWRAAASKPRSRFKGGKRRGDIRRPSYA